MLQKVGVVSVTDVTLCLNTLFDKNTKMMPLHKCIFILGKTMASFGFLSHETKQHFGNGRPKIWNLTYVSGCPNAREYNRRASETCNGLGELFRKHYMYHCMRDASKTKLVEFCAIPRLLFDYCPEYDQKNEKIQFDQTTLCISNVSQKIYSSSDMFFCKQDDCHKLHGTSPNTGETVEIQEQTNKDLDTETRMTYVITCQDASDLEHRVSDRCDEVCEHFPVHCDINCMLETYKTNRLKFCQKRIILSDQCPVYNQKTKTIQLDNRTSCISNSSQSHYNSSDIVFCDPARCHKTIETPRNPDAPNQMEGLINFMVLIAALAALVWILVLIVKFFPKVKKCICQSFARIKGYGRPPEIVPERRDDHEMRDMLNNEVSSDV